MRNRVGPQKVRGGSSPSKCPAGSRPCKPRLPPSRAPTAASRRLGQLRQSRDRGETPETPTKPQTEVFETCLRPVSDNKTASLRLRQTRNSLRCLNLRLAVLSQVSHPLSQLSQPSQPSAGCGLPKKEIRRPKTESSPAGGIKRSGQRPFFCRFLVPSGHLGVPSWHLGVPSGHSAERALGKRAERAL